MASSQPAENMLTQLQLQLSATSKPLPCDPVMLRASWLLCQVALAQLQYQLPRLTRMWSHLERQAGGRVRGMGEKQLEVDKRLMRTRIGQLQVWGTVGTVHGVVWLGSAEHHLG